MDKRLVLAVFSLFVEMAATTIKGANELPAVTVTGNVKPTPPGDTVSRDWAARSPEMNWPTTMLNGASEIFTHNQIVINASCATVWEHLVQAVAWPQWCPFTGKVQIWGGATVLQKNGKFTWVSSDLPQDIPALGNVSAPSLEKETRGVRKLIPRNGLGGGGYTRARSTT